MNKKLTRSSTDCKIAGVCGGIAAYFGCDSTPIRIAFLAALLLGCCGGLLYLICWIVMPKDNVLMP
ncbi:MAG: PspC domain-containing protein [Bacteroidales bacterium]|nr:PspC domain-containing protein [Bacteroidales bacterium]